MDSVFLFCVSFFPLLFGFAIVLGVVVLCVPFLFGFGALLGVDGYIAGVVSLNLFDIRSCVVYWVG